MNKRIKKKHIWLGSKRAGTNHCATEILRHIIRKCDDAGIEPNIRNIKKYIRWFYHKSSQAEWDKRVADTYVPWQMVLSAKHLLKSIPDKKDVVENSLSVKVAKQLNLDNTTIDRINKLLTREGGDNNSLNPQSKVWVDSTELDKLIRNIEEGS
jgi:hypothetical protein